MNVVRHKLYNNFQWLSVSIDQWKDLSIDFVTRLPVSTNWKDDIYNSILVMIDQLIKMIYYVPVKVIIDILHFAEIIYNMVIRHHSLLNSIVSDWGLIFILKFIFLLYYFFEIKWRLLTTFYPQTDSQIKKQNSIIKAYLQAFINFK